MNRKTHISLRYSFPLLMLANSIAWAEISSLSQEELTDTYIKDTTVIVRQQEPEKSKTSVPVSLKVTPLEEATQVLPQDQAHTTSAISNELSTYDDLNKGRALSNALAPQLPIATTEFLKAPLNQDLITLMQKNGYSISSASDLLNQNFKPKLAENIDIKLDKLSPNLGLTADGRSFTITIPNLGNFNSQQIASPNGEVGVNVTPSHIEYTLNLPK